MCRTGGSGRAGSDDDDVSANGVASVTGGASGNWSEEQRHTLLVKVFTNNDPLYAADFGPLTKANLSAGVLTQSGFAARCSATMPPVRFRHATSLQPASATRVASAFWSGQAWIDSAR